MEESSAEAELFHNWFPEPALDTSSNSKQGHFENEVLKAERLKDYKALNRYETRSEQFGI